MASAVYQCQRCKAKVSLDVPDEKQLDAHAEAFSAHHAKDVGCPGKLVKLAAPAAETPAPKEDAEDKPDSPAQVARQRRG